MDKLIKYLKRQNLTDEVIDVVLNNIKVKYVVPTYYYKDLSFTDLLVFEDTEEFSDDDDDINDTYMSTLIADIVHDKAFSLVPNQGTFNHIKEGEEYWAIHNDKPPINVVVDSIKKQIAWSLYTYNYIYFLDKATNKKFSFIDNVKNADDLKLFSTKEEAVKFYKDKFDLN